MNVQDDEEPAEDEFKPDGGYIPRIFYIDPSSQRVRTDIYNKQGSEQYKYPQYSHSSCEIVTDTMRYFYSGAAAVVSGMKDALARFHIY